MADPVLVVPDLFEVEKLETPACQLSGNILRPKNIPPLNHFGLIDKVDLDLDLDLDYS